ncbi:YceD family protein [Solicola sp. PLA-1-18]|uniref:YceD family protein n=1 Tax=Solicola sp. PLA-1-18 TaxID=3380532 RepID=UPI003B7A5E7A
MLDTRELGRRPGTQKTVTTTEEAPADLGIDVIGVPESSGIDLELRLESVMEGVLVTGSAAVQLEGQCVRCLEDLHEDLEVDLQELYVYDDADVPADEDDEGVRRLEGDLLDLEPVLRDAVVLTLPQNPLCRPDCPGLCAECGARLADDPDHTHGEALDPRWAALDRLKQDQTDDGQLARTVKTPGDQPGDDQED